MLWLIYPNLRGARRGVSPHVAGAMTTTISPRTNRPSGEPFHPAISSRAANSRNLAPLPLIYSIEQLEARYQTETTVLKEILARHFDRHSKSALLMHSGT